MEKYPFDPGPVILVSLATHAPFYFCKPPVYTFQALSSTIILPVQYA